MNFFSFIADWVKENPGKTLGGLAGFILGILLVTFEIWKTLLIVLLIFIGYLIGKSRDEDMSIIDQIRGLFRRDR